MTCYILLFTALHSSMYRKWPRVRECIDELKAMEKPWITEGSYLALLKKYVIGAYLQGTGDLDAASKAFQDPVFDLKDGQNVRPRQDICLLAALNRIWILQKPERWDDSLQSDLLEVVQRLCVGHPDPYIRSAHHIMLATIKRSKPAPMQEIKANLQSVFALSNTIHNTHQFSICLIITRYVLFDNIVGDQALKSAMAASYQSKRFGNVLLESVADGLLAQSLGFQGKPGEAKEAKESAVKCANDVFAGVL